MHPGLEDGWWARGCKAGLGPECFHLDSQRQHLCHNYIHNQVADDRVFVQGKEPASTLERRTQRSVTCI